MFSHLIILELYFPIQCFEGSFLIENIFVFIIITANLLTDILKYLAKILGEVFWDFFWWVTTRDNNSDSENLA